MGLFSRRGAGQAKADARQERARALLVPVQERTRVEQSAPRTVDPEPSPVAAAARVLPPSGTSVGEAPTAHLGFADGTSMPADPATVRQLQQIAAELLRRS